jgi:hypothetical protein
MPMHAPRMNGLDKTYHGPPAPPAELEDLHLELTETMATNDELTEKRGSEQDQSDTSQDRSVSPDHRRFDEQARRGNRSGFALTHITP